MKIDLEYLKLIIEEFISSDTAYIESKNFSHYINENLEKFIFHWEIMSDKNLIVDNNDKRAKIIYISSNVRTYPSILIRLTDEGYKFYDALKDKEILSKLKTDFKSFSFDSLSTVAKKLVEKKLEDLIS